MIVVALDVSGERAAIDKLVAKQKLDTLRLAPGKGWQEKFGLSEAIPVTLVVDGGRVRVVHDSVIPLPVEYLEADLVAVHKAGN